MDKQTDVTKDPLFKELRHDRYKLAAACSVVLDQVLADGYGESSLVVQTLRKALGLKTLDL